MIYFEI